MAAFTPGNIIVYRVGTGAAALSSAATAVFLDEYTPAGVLVQSIALPTADAGANQTLTASGTATSEGLLTRSADGRYIILTGYDAPPGTASVASSATSSVTRVIGRVDSSGNIDTTTTTTAFSANNIRSAISSDGTSFWATGANTGVVSLTLGNAGAGTTVASTVLNLRALEIYDGQLYVGTGSGSTVRIGSVGSGLPTTTGQTITQLPSLPLTGSPYQFVLLDLTTSVAGVDTLYIADDTPGTILKYSLVSGSWVANGSITLAGVRGLTGSSTGTTANFIAASATTLSSFTDTTGYNATISATVTTLATAATNTAFRGVAFAPLESQTVSMAVSPTAQNEGDSGTITYTFTVSRTGGTAGALAFVANFSAGDTNAADFGGTAPGTINGTIPAGQASTTFTVTVSGDTTIESSENFAYTVASASNASAVVAIGTATATATIINDDGAGTVSVSNVTIVEGDSGSSNAVITLTRTGGSGDFSVDYQTANGTATAGSDYTATSGTANFTNGAATVTINVPISGDTVFESNETFSFSLSNATNGSTIGTGTATVTITNDDPSPTIIYSGDNSLVGATSTPTSTNAIQLIRQGSIGGIGGAGAESVAFDSAAGRLYVTNPATSSVDVFQIASDGSLSSVGSIALSGQPGFNSVNSVAVRNGVVAIAYDTVGGNSAGHVQLYDTATRTLQRDLLVGVGPDQLTFTPDGNRILVANEAEAVSSSNNPAGSISIIDLSGGAASATVAQTIGFSGISVPALQAAGVAVLTSQGLNDIEPEYITVSPDGTRAYVTLQEVNAVAVLDLTNTSAIAPLAIQALGAVNHSLAGNAFDPSDQDGGINLRQLNILGLRQPDAIASFSVGGTTYFITANEGDSRVGTGITDTARLSTVTLDPTAYPDRATLQSNAVAGRLTVLTQLGDTDGDGDIDQIYTIGGRGFTIFRQNADGTISTVRESGGEFEAIIARDYASLFNSNQSVASSSVDTRSDDKGPEPEGVAVGVINVGGVDHTYAFISNERVGGIMVYDVSDPANAHFVYFIPETSSDLGPEVITFISATNSPTGGPLIVTANEVSGTTTVYRVAIPTSGADTVTGGSANDVLVGNDGNDVFLLQQGGNDTVSGGLGNDGFYFGSAFDGNDKVDGGAGALDQIGLQGSYASLTLGANSLVGIEQVVLLSASDGRFGASPSSPVGYNIITGDAAIGAGVSQVFQANTLASGENFTLDASGELDGSVFTYAGRGTDSLTGSQNDDAFFFGSGRFNPTDIVDGQGGNDQLGLQGDYSGANAITLGAGQLLNLEMIVLLSNNDTRFGGAGSGTPYSYSLTTNDGNVAAGQTLIIQGNNLASDEILTFNGAAETDGSFTIYSGDANDVITGGAQFDIISGRGGADILMGGGGNDVFLYTNLSDSVQLAADHIGDFTVGDKIDLSVLDAITGGANDSFSFIGSNAFSNVAGELRATNTSGSDWLVEADVNGDGVADLSILVTTADAHALTAADFVL